MPLVSVVIPTYNRAHSIAESVHSVLRQTFTDFELIVVDDCSRDDTTKMLESITDLRLRVLSHDTNRGANAARNTGIHAAAGTYVAFQDSDDEWLPSKLEKQLAAMQEFGPDSIGAYCAMVVLEQTNGVSNGLVNIRLVPSRTDVPLDGHLKHSLLGGFSLISTQTLIVKRSVILAAGGFDDSLPALQDWDCCLRLAEYGPFAFVNEPLVIQRFSPDSISHSAEKRVWALSRIIAKEEPYLRGMPQYATPLYRILAGGLRRLGYYREARDEYRKILQFAPLSIRGWGGLLVSSIMDLWPVKKRQALPT